MLYKRILTTLTLLFLTLVLLTPQTVSASSGLASVGLQVGDGEFLVTNLTKQLVISVTWSNKSIDAKDVKLKLTSPDSKVIQENDFGIENDQNDYTDIKDLNYVAVVKDSIVNPRSY